MSARKNTHTVGSVLRDAANDFATKEQPTSEETNAFQELFYTLALNCDPTDRKHVANALARGLYTPRSIAYYFGLDSLEIAAPVLRYSPVLNNRDFVSLIMRSEFDHIRVIAQRDDLELETVNAIIAVDNDNRVLLEIMRSSERLMRNPEIRSALDKAYGIVRHTIEENPTPSEINMGLLGEEDITDLSEALLSLASTGGKVGRNQTRLRASQSRPLNHVEGRLLRNAKDLNFSAFAYSVERECRLPSKFTLSTLKDKNAGDLATILASLDVSRFIASRIMLILIPDFGRDVNVFKLVLENYEKLDHTECREYLTGKGAKFGDPTQVFFKRAQGHQRQADIKRPTQEASRTANAA